MGVTDLKRDVIGPLVAAMLGILPLELFVGISNTVKVNGRIVQDTHFNLLGVVLAVTGALIAWRCLVTTGSNRLLRSGLAGLAILFCLVQLLLSTGFLTLDKVKGTLGAPSLPAIGYTGLNEGTEQMARNIAANYDQMRLHADIVARYASMLSDADWHMMYADACHKGLYRVDIEGLRTFPDFLSGEDRAEIDKRVAHYKPKLPFECSESGSHYNMVERIRSVLRARDVIAIEVDQYRKRFRSQQ